jgi:phosphonate transport system substrate-binding protein
MITRCLMFVLLLSLAAPAWSEVITFAPLPMENRETVLKQFMPMAIYLRQTLGLEVRFDYSDSYDQILEKFRAGVIDLAYLGPLPYVSLKARADHAEPLVHFKESDGKPLYTCAIVALADRKIDLASLSNQKVALTQPLSTCGFLSTNGLLRERGSSLARNLFRYLDKHDEVALAVVRGEYEIGGIKTAIGRKYAHLGLNVLAETAPLPSFALIANTKTLKPETRSAIRTALAGLDPAGKDKDMLALWGDNIRHGSALASDRDYAPVRALLGGETIPTTGNF